jgi:hypothetical protein
MRAEDFKCIVGDVKQLLGITSRLDVERSISFVAWLAKYSDNKSLSDDIWKLYDEVDNINTADLMAVGCDDKWWRQ